MTPAAALPLAIDFHAIEGAVRAATGWSGLLIIFIYSFLIAFVLPLPSEVVLCPAGYVCGSVATLGLGIPAPLTVVLIILVSGVGKAAGSLIALYVGHGASHSGPVVRAFERLGFDPMEWSKQRMVELVKEYGYAGMALGLTVPGFPDTLSIYAFSVIEENYAKFAAATFTGSVGRLVVTIVVLEGLLLAF
ncbi:YqaA family protein [Halobacterium zhouii]|uniref:YqaA family protein n=1 Tax=Halobacterium zhouii TaxID=2902624 RepID=UPI001E527E98|nr:VTT domain-containing protein [Halobacterium zhouii]